MRKLSKILAVVLTVVLLCGMIATMISANDTEVIYPEYVAPSAANVLWTNDFEGSASVGTSASNGFFGSKTTDGTNNYFNITNWIDEELSESLGKQYGSVLSGNRDMLGGDYFALSFDFMADKYTNGEELISAEDYNDLTADEQVGFVPSYVQTYYYMEMPYIAKSYDSLWVKKFGNDWYLTTQTGTADANSYKLPSEVGVWTNVTMLVKTDVVVNYTEGGVEKSLTYAQYLAANKPESATATVVVNTDFAIYVNGEYAFDYDSLDRVDTEYAFSSFTGQNIKFKYMQMQAGKDSSARVNTPMSMCYDNITGAIYTVGNDGGIAEAFENRSSILTCDGAIFSTNYNKVSQLGATVTKANGDVYGYMTASQAYSAAEDGDVIELLVSTNATLDLSDSTVKSLTIKTNGYYFNCNSDGKYDVVDNGGVYTVSELKYAAPAYAGPVGPTRYGNFYDYEGNGSSKFHSDGTASNKDTASDKDLLTGSGEKVMYGNTYAGYALVDYAGSQVTDMVRLGGWYNTPILKYDYVTIDLDIVADMYRNTTTGALISIAEYNALSDSAKAGYEASYHELQFYNEFSFSYQYAHMLQLRKVDGKYAIVDNNSSFCYYLPEEAGVWTHITWVTTLGNTVTYYTDETKTTTATMSYADYVASGKGETYYVSTNLKDTIISVYVNGEYQGDLAGFNDALTNTTSYANLAKVYYKYLFVKGAAQSSNSTFRQNFSMGFDNNFFYTYAEGYNGGLVNAKETGLQNSTDTVYNAGYNKTNSPYIIGITNVGDELGYKFTNVKAAKAYLKEGASVELLANVTAPFDMAGLNSLTVITNGYKFAYASSDGAGYTETVNDGTLVLEKAKYGAPVYVGPVGVSSLWNFSDFSAADYKKFYAANGLVHSNVNTGANIYSNITNWVDGAISEHTTNNSYGNLGNVYTKLGYGDYFVWSFDIMADKYTDGKTLITIAQYNALSAEDKANFKPSYATTAYMIEIPAYNCYNYLWIKEIDGKWYFTDKNGKASAAFALPEVAGVWTNISIVFKTDMKVGELDYNDYVAAGEPGKDAAQLTINVEALVYANGEYAFNYMDATTLTKAYADYDSSFKYAQMKAGTDSSARVKTPMSICYDNVSGWRYPEGYKGDFVNAIANKAPLHNVLDSIYNKTYNKTSTYVAAVYGGEESGSSYFASESAYAAVKEGYTIELLADAAATYVPAVNTTYVKTNGYDFKYSLPEGYTYYETETAGVYVLKVADENDSVEVKWYVDGELYATTTEVIGSTPNGPAVDTVKVHPWVSKGVVSWADANGNRVVKAGVDNEFSAEFGYFASPEILMNISTAQAFITNHYIPGLTEEELSEVSDIFFGINSTTSNLWTTSGRVTNVTVNGKAYYKVSETMRIIYMAMVRNATFSFTYAGQTFTLEYGCSNLNYFDRILSSNNYSDVEKELIYAALDYSDAVAVNSGMGSFTGYSALVAKYAEYKSDSTSTIDEIIATAKKQNNTNGFITGYKLTIYDGYAAMFAFEYDAALAPEGFDLKDVVVKYNTISNGAEKTLNYRKPDDKKTHENEINLGYGISVYDVRQDLTLVIGDTESTFNLASYIKALVEGGYAADSVEMRVAIALYNYSECSEAYKRS